MQLTPTNTNTNTNTNMASETHTVSAVVSLACGRSGIFYDLTPEEIEAMINGQLDGVKVLKTAGGFYVDGAKRTGEYDFSGNIQALKAAGYPVDGKLWRNKTAPIGRWARLQAIDANTIAILPEPPKASGYLTRDLSTEPGKPVQPVTVPDGQASLASLTREMVELDMVNALVRLGWTCSKGPR